MTELKRAEHRVILEALRLMDASFLATNQCWFGGGTSIVLKLGEYRQSLDVDFLCADPDGYRELRSAAVERGIRAFFPAPVEPLRTFKIDQYGLRTALRHNEQVIKFEIIREARIELCGHIDSELGLPMLVEEDLFAEKLLANADRCHDRSVAYRDAIDLGMLVHHHKNIPDNAIAKAEGAYGADIVRKLAWVVSKLNSTDELQRASEVLQMEMTDARRSIRALTGEVMRRWPDHVQNPIGSFSGV